MNINEKAKFIALAKLLGAEESYSELEKKFSKYYEGAKQVLSASQEPNKVEVGERPSWL
mgnify:FL=1